MTSLAQRIIFGEPLHTPVRRPPSHRIVSGLQLAWECDKPGFIPKRPSSNNMYKRADGRRFEKAVSSLLPKGSRQGVWFQFLDENGKGLCQPDWLVPLDKKHILIVECKRTECPEAFSQLTDLYFPIVEKALGLKPFGMVVVNYLTTASNPQRIFSTFEVALDAAQSGIIPILHWMR